MIYPEPIFRFLGDSYVGVEFGDDADLRNNFRVMAMIEAVQHLRLPWIVDLIPTLREFGIVYDKTLTTPSVVRDAISEVLPSVQTATVVKSRLFKLPVWYGDPWSAELNAKAGLQSSLDIVAQANDLTVPELVDRHTSTDHWVSCVGWAPGCFFAYPVERAKGVTGPKLKSPRPYAPARILTLGGLCTAAMPFSGPSGYQMLGRLAVPIYAPGSAIPDIPPHGVVFRAGDRHRYVSVTPLQYEEVRERIARRTFEYDVAEEDFPVTALLAGGYHD
jgi:allophanate hydrolase subunit 1